MGAEARDAPEDVDAGAREGVGDWVQAGSRVATRRTVAALRIAGELTAMAPASAIRTCSGTLVFASFLAPASARTLIVGVQTNGNGAAGSPRRGACRRERPYTRTRFHRPVRNTAAL